MLDVIDSVGEWRRRRQLVCRCNTAKSQSYLRCVSEQNEGYQQALSLLHACATEHGFVASPVDKANYHRVWGRDGSLLSLAALLTDDDDLKQSSRRTLLTLAKYQGPHGEIPSNVDPDTDRISYGGTTGRVDADLWFLIAVHAYWRATEDDTFLDQVRPAVEKVRFLLGCWEFNNRGLLFIPPTGDWADEYLQTGYVLYDQLLYYYAQCGISRIHAMLHDSADHQLIERIDRLKHLIQANYWFDGEKPDDTYHPILYDKGKESRKRREAKYWMPSFSPTGYSYRFDAFANILCSMLEVADHEQRRHVDEHLHEISPNEFPLVRAFHPVVRPADDNWKDLQITFSYEFKNQPHEYHNGGLWPLLTGFYAADLAMRGQKAEARRRLAALDRANALEMEGEPWGFPEFIHGEKLLPGGTSRQGWSAAAAVIAYQALEGKRVFPPLGP